MRNSYSRGNLSFVRKPTGRCFQWFQVVGVAMFFHIAVEERSMRVQEDFHVMVYVIPPPDAHAGGSVEAYRMRWSMVSNFRLRDSCGFHHALADRF